MTPPLISFIIPTYNRERSIRQAVTSVLNEFGEESSEVEVIVIDDGSTDGTQQLLAPFCDISSIRVFTFDQNRGLATARNTGVAAARGEWIALLDSDNALLSGVGVFLTSLLRSLPPEVGVMWGGSVDSSGNATITHQRSGIVDGREVIDADDIEGEHFSVIRRALMIESPYPTSAGSHACEAAFWATVAQRTQFYITPQQFQYYDTTGTDRICAVDNRIHRAVDFAKCFELTAERLGDFSPRRAGRARSRAALYWCLAGSWGKSARSATGALVHGPVTRDGIGILAICLLGPRIARALIRRR